MTNNPYIEIDSSEMLAWVPSRTGLVEHCAFQYIDFNEAGYGFRANTFADCVFMGCVIPEDMKPNVLPSCLVFPRMHMIYKPFRNALYSGEELYEGFDMADDESYAECFDARVYKDYVGAGKHCSDITITLARAIHDHSVTDAMKSLLDEYDERSVVAVMGGHAMRRTDAAYAQIVRISKSLTEKGLLMVSGGGPGAMEATHLGAWLAGRNEEDVAEALKIIAVAPTCFDAGWVSSAFEVRDRFPQSSGYRSLGIPTWFYGHEPATPFATHIAKYFDNSIREDRIIQVSRGGIIFSPGSAGTIQEIFQSAVLDHYLVYGYACPMIFLGKDFYTNEIPVYPLIQDLLSRGRYKNLQTYITDSDEEVIQVLAGAFSAT